MNRIFKKLLMLCITGLLFACNNAPLIYDATIKGKEILTPATKDEPEINGASVFGVRPGKSIFYHIGASGIKPISYSAEVCHSECK